MASPSNVSAEVDLGDRGALIALTGPQNAHLKALQRELRVELGTRGNMLYLSGAPEEVAFAERFFQQVEELGAAGVKLDSQDHARAVHALRGDAELHLRDVFTEVILVNARGRSIKARGLAQKRYLDAIREHDLTFGIGPAGTGKTYLAMAMAIQALAAKQVRRIILTRPAVEAGEKLGFLPGDLAEKVNPYLRPLYDALDDMMDSERVEQLIKRGQVEVAPLAFMRGRTLNDCFVILDEAQNATSEQMRMFLTRLGYESRAVVTGDITQVDLPSKSKSGLAEARTLLSHIEGISFCSFSEVDVVRHPLVQRIVVAYEQRDAATAARRAAAERAGRTAAAERASSAGSQPGAETASDYERAR